MSPKKLVKADFALLHAIELARLKDAVSVNVHRLWKVGPSNGTVSVAIYRVLFFAQQHAVRLVFGVWLKGGDASACGVASPAEKVAHAHVARLVRVKVSWGRRH